MDIHRIVRITNILRTKFPIDIVEKIVKETIKPSKLYVLTITIASGPHYSLTISSLYISDSRDNLIQFLQNDYSFSNQNYRVKCVEAMKNRDRYSCRINSNTDMSFKITEENFI